MSIIDLDPRLAELLGTHVDDIRTPDENDINEQQSLFFQVSLALLIIFIMAAVLYRLEAQREVKRAQDAAEHISGILGAISDTDVGRAHEAVERSIIDLQYQKLLNALAAVESEEREAVCPRCFLRPDGSRVAFNVTTVLANGTVSADAAGQFFARSCKTARERLQDLEALKTDWRGRVLKKAGLRLPTRGLEKEITTHPNVVSDANLFAISDDIAGRAKALRVDTRNLQRAAIKVLFEYYEAHPSQINDPEIRDQIQKFGELIEHPHGKPEEVSQVIEQLGVALNHYARSAFEKGGAPLLGQDD